MCRLSRRRGFPATTRICGLDCWARLPRESVKLLHAEVVKLLQSPDVKQRMAQLGAEPIGSTPEQFGAYIKAEIVKWEKVVKASGARAD